MKSLCISLIVGLGWTGAAATSLAARASPVVAVTADLADPGLADSVAGIGSSMGSAVASTGDLNGDGIGDFIAGVPAFAPDGGPVHAGAALVYFGSTSLEERVQPDIFFVGASEHARAGHSLAADFDFNGDGRLDLLIGAPAIDPDGVPTGSGKAYLIYFDPNDLVHYPNIGDPSTPDQVDLSRVGQDDGVPGVVFEGIAFGDRAGSAVAAGGQVNLTPGPDLLIGAPGRARGNLRRAGAAYVIYDDSSLSGVVSLADVAGTGGDAVAGSVYLGVNAFDALGFSVEFPGDVNGSEGDDLALGAPTADPLEENEGIVYVVEGGELGQQVVVASSIGADPRNRNAQGGTQIQGAQAGEQLGWSIGGGADNGSDGDTDLLIGAPFHDSASAVDAGRVVHSASRLPAGVISVDAIGEAVEGEHALPGAIWVGGSAGDHLGLAVAGLDDVTGNGVDDVVFAAPSSDPQGVEDGGAAYLIPGTRPQAPRRGTFHVDDDFPGIRLVGSSPGGQAGFALSMAGDADDDGALELLVGAPRADPTDDGGTVYIVHAASCGNDELDPGEECDDGNNDNGDGCSATCSIEPVPSCPDADGDDWAVCDGSCTPDPGDQCGDCDDQNPDANPGREEICGNGFDDDCDDGTSDFVLPSYCDTGEPGLLRRAESVRERRRHLLSTARSDGRDLQRAG